MGYQTLDVELLSGAMGAVLHGPDLSTDLSNQTFDEIHQLLQSLILDSVCQC